MTEKEKQSLQEVRSTLLLTIEYIVLCNQSLRHVKPMVTRGNNLSESVATGIQTLTELIRQCN